MIPYLHFFGLSLPTFGLMLWLAAVTAALLLHLNFQRHGVVADAMTIVASATLAGVLGAKAWHELEHPLLLWLTIEAFAGELRSHPGGFLPDFFDWAKGGFAWFGGMAAGILTLLWQARSIPPVETKPGRTSGRMKALTMLDLAAPSAAVGYGIGRIGCHLSGDGDYGIPTHLPWGVSYANGLVPTPPGVLVHPTPIYEFLFSMALGYYLWKRGSAVLPRGRLVGEYLLLAGAGRFLVEFIRINPRVFLGMTNAQLGSVGSMAAGAVLVVWTMRRGADLSAGLKSNPVSETTA